MLLTPRKMSLVQQAAELSEQDFSSIPIIDITNALSPEFAKRQALAEEIRRACLNVGFFYVKNHAVSETTVEKAFEQSKLFFDLPDDVKRTVDISKSDNFRGFQALLTENTDPHNKGDLHEAFNLGLDPSLSTIDVPNSNSGLKHSDNLWPQSVDWEGAEQFKENVLQYYKEVLDLGLRLFPLFALALDLNEDFFADKTKHPAAIQRLLYYPPLGEREADERILGIGAHTDYESFTILRQGDVAALQVKNRAGQWIDAPCIPGTFVINIGDQLARWTNDVFLSTPHRALPPATKTRYSIPFFFGCDHDVPLTPIPTCVSEQSPAKYDVVTAGEYVHSRLTETYGHGEGNA